MRTLERNKQTFYFAPNQGKQPLVDAEGKETGEYGLKYGAPVAVRGHVSVGVTEVMRELFGITERCERMIILDVLPAGLDSECILWVDQTDLSKPYDYMVSSSPKGKSHIVIGIRRVNVGA
jgi:hypothetical protein